MTGRKPGPTERRMLRVERVAELRIMGMTIRAIAAEVGVSPRTIEKDLAIVEEKWRERTTHKIDVWKGREIARLELVIREAFAAWIRSKEPFAKTVERMGQPQAQRSRRPVTEISDDMLVIDHTPDPHLIVTSRTTTFSERDGNYHFLEVVLQASAQIAQILGLNSAAELSLSIRSYVERSAKELGISPDALQEEIDRVAEQAWDSAWSAQG